MKRVFTRAAITVAALGITGCSFLGPDSIRNGRPAYNDAILATNDSDLTSKQWFLMLQLLASASVPDTAHVGPVLTIPAGKR
jgi:hypothetical protein